MLAHPNAVNKLSQDCSAWYGHCGFDHRYSAILAIDLAQDDEDHFGLSENHSMLTRNCKATEEVAGPISNWDQTVRCCACPAKGGPAETVRIRPSAPLGPGQTGPGLSQPDVAERYVQCHRQASHLASV